jgi:chromosome segregation ATPase
MYRPAKNLPYTKHHPEAPMRTALFILLSLFPATLPALAQSTPTDSRTLQAIFEEIHKLRQDLQTTTASAQRAQILLYRVRLQMDTVERLNQRLEQAHSGLIQARNEQDHLLQQKKFFEDQLQSTQDLANRKNIEVQLAGMESLLERTKDNQPDAEAKEAALTNELRTEQSKLDDLQEQLERLDKKLEAQQQQSQAHP